jgi:hypothetical protein
VAIRDRFTSMTRNVAFLALVVAVLPAGPSRAAEVPAMAKIHTKVLISPRELETDGPVLDELAYQQTLRRAARMKGVDLTTLPAVTIRQDQAGTIEIIREGPPKADAPDPPFVGWVARFDPEPAGRQLKLEVRITHAFAPGEHMPPAEQPPPDVNWERVVTRSAEARGRLSAGQALVIKLGEVEPGVHATCFVQVTPIDATGRPAADFSVRIPVEEPVPGLPVGLRGRLLEVPGGARALPGAWQERDAPPRLLGVFSNEQLEQLTKPLLARPGAELRRFEETRVRTSERSAPWMDLPEVTILAKLANPQAEVVDLSFRLPSRGGFATTGISIFAGHWVLLELPAGDPADLRALAVSADPAAGN